MPTINIEKGNGRAKGRNGWINARFINAQSFPGAFEGADMLSGTIELTVSSSKRSDNEPVQVRLKASDMARVAAMLTALCASHPNMTAHDMALASAEADLVLPA